MDDELREAVASDGELTVIARRLAMAFDQADSDPVRQRTLQAGIAYSDAAAIVSALDISQSDLEAMADYIARRADALAEQYPAWADRARRT
jgi:hypothetical protein